MLKLRERRESYVKDVKSFSSRSLVPLAHKCVPCEITHVFSCVENGPEDGQNYIKNLNRYRDIFVFWRLGSAKVREGDFDFFERKRTRLSNFSSLSFLSRSYREAWVFVFRDTSYRVSQWRNGCDAASNRAICVYPRWMTFERNQISNARALRSEILEIWEYIRRDARTCDSLLSIRHDERSPPLKRGSNAPMAPCGQLPRFPIYHRSSQREISVFLFLCFPVFFLLSARKLHNVIARRGESDDEVNFARMIHLLNSSWPAA